MRATMNAPFDGPVHRTGQGRPAADQDLRSFSQKARCAAGTGRLASSRMNSEIAALFDEDEAPAPEPEDAPAEPTS
jgi:hypothetical protein